MNWEHLVREMPELPRGLSLLLVEPKAEFLGWLESFLKIRGRGKLEVYFPAENSVWAIPSYQRLADDYDAFLHKIKPRLLSAELYRFGAVEADFPQPITSEVFDDFFALSLRDEARAIAELIKPI